MSWKGATDAWAEDLVKEALKRQEANPTIWQTDCSEKIYTWDIPSEKRGWLAGWEKALLACKENPSEENWRKLADEIDDAIQLEREYYE